MLLKGIKDKTIIIISHNHKVLEICDLIFEVKDKKMSLRKDFCSVASLEKSKSLESHI